MSCSVYKCTEVFLLIQAAFSEQLYPAGDRDELESSGGVDFNTEP